MGDLYEISNAVLSSMADYVGEDMGTEVYNLDFSFSFAATESFEKEDDDGSKTYVSNLPAVVSTSVDVNDLCSVCMDSFNLIKICGVVNDDGKQCVKQVPCGHIYHADCITTWLSRHNSCPLCRNKIVTD